MEYGRKLEKKFKEESNEKKNCMVWNSRIFYVEPAFSGQCLTANPKAN
jgi:hypothetical protein